MTHNRDHIVIHSLTAPVTFSEEAQPGKLQLWHLAAGAALVGFLVGALIA